MCADIVGQIPIGRIRYRKGDLHKVTGIHLATVLIGDADDIVLESGRGNLSRNLMRRLDIAADKLGKRDT